MEAFCFEECEDCSDLDTCTRCKEGFYLTEKVCKVCNFKCKSCSEPSMCTICEEGYVLSFDFFCIVQCPSGYFTGDNRTCAKCPPMCLTCLDLQDCTSCIAEYVMHSSQCLTECPKNSWLSSNLCNPCDSRCDQCLGPTNADCIECLLPYHRFRESALSVVRELFSTQANALRAMSSALNAKISLPAQSAL